MKLVKLSKFTVIAATFGFAALSQASGQHSGAHWGYKGANGPENWSRLAEEFKVCGQGTRQSPINVAEENAIHADLALSINYKPVEPEIVNNGHTIQVNYAPGSSINIAGKNYQLLQFHFHTPSENKLGGKSFPMEMHLVHKSKDGKLAVVAVFIETGSENQELKAAWEQMPMQVGEHKKISNSPISAAKLLPKNKQYAQFKGSLTTPPCSEGVNWVVLKSPIHVSKQQLAKFQKVVGENARPVQPLNDRFVLAKH